MGQRGTTAVTSTVPTDKSALRDASTVIILRDKDTSPCILMGQRGAKAAFMPNKFVFPGGAVDATDKDVPLAQDIASVCKTRLEEDAPSDLAHALCVAAIRELWEETGLILGSPGEWNTPPHADWTAYAATGHLPNASALQFVFRAITPPGRPRRFDARFFLVDAQMIAGDLDDFGAASDELSHLQWVPLADARHFDMPFITEIVLAEVQSRVSDPDRPDSVPFFKNDDEESLFLRLKGLSRQTS